MTDFAILYEHWNDWFWHSVWALTRLILTFRMSIDITDFAIPYEHWYDWICHSIWALISLNLPFHKSIDIIDVGIPYEHWNDWFCHSVWALIWLILQFHMNIDMINFGIPYENLYDWCWHSAWVGFAGVVVRIKRVWSTSLILSQRERIPLFGANYYVNDPFIIYLLAKKLNKTLYIQNNPLVNSSIYYKSATTSLRVWIHTNLHRYDVTLKQILLVMTYM